MHKIDPWQLKAENFQDELVSFQCFSPNLFLCASAIVNPLTIAFVIMMPKLWVFIGILVFVLGIVSFFRIGGNMSFARRWKKIRKTSYGHALQDLVKKKRQLPLLNPQGRQLEKEINDTITQIWEEAHYAMNMVKIEIPDAQCVIEEKQRREKEEHENYIADQKRKLQAAEFDLRLYQKQLLSTSEQKLIAQATEELDDSSSLKLHRP